MDLPLGPDRPDTPALDAPEPDRGEASDLAPASHGETLAAAVDADPIAQTQALALGSAYGRDNVPGVLAAVHAGGPEALADLTAHPEQYGPFTDTPETRQHLSMLAGTLPHMDDYGGINAVLSGVPRPEADRGADPAQTAAAPRLEETVPRQMEPRWGQLATSAEIVREIREGLAGHDVSELSFSAQALILRGHFGAQSAPYARDEGSNVYYRLTDAPDVDRYVYTTQEGWIDMRHVFQMAYSSGHGWMGTLNGPRNRAMSRASEWLQDGPGAYSYEDLPSNRIGMEFAAQYGTRVNNHEMSMEDAMHFFLSERGAVRPELAPNFDYIPFDVSRDPPKRHTSDPLTGRSLREAHRAVYDQWTPEQRRDVDDAHRQIPR